MPDPRLAHSNPSVIEDHYPRLRPGKNTPRRKKSFPQARCVECGKAVVAVGPERTFQIWWEGKRLAGEHITGVLS